MRGYRPAHHGWVAYFAITLPLKLDLFLHGPVTKLLSAATGLPIQ